MISTCLRLSRSSLIRTPIFSMNHIKNMREQNIRVKMQEAENAPAIEKNEKVYKPSHTIEFNRTGQILLYSANPVTTETIYFRYPYIIYESLIPLGILNYVLNPLDMVWYWTSFGLYGSLALIIPRIWFLHEFKFSPMEVYLMRGGRNIRIQAQNMGADKFTYWGENRCIRYLTEDKKRFGQQDVDEFLTADGKLSHDLDVEFSELKVWGVNTNDQQIHFKKYGTVHEPELFQAVMKGYTIDTTDFVINTADNIRYREPNHNL